MKEDISKTYQTDITVIAIGLVIIMLINILAVLAKFRKDDGVVVNRYFSNTERTTRGIDLNTIKTGVYGTKFSPAEEISNAIIGSLNSPKVNICSGCLNLFQTCQTYSKATSNTDEILRIPEGAAYANFDIISIYQWTEIYHNSLNKEMTRSYYLIQVGNDMIAVTLEHIGKRSAEMSFNRYYIKQTATIS